MTTTRQPRIKLIIGMLLLAHVLLGVGVATMMPPFEGFDETAHFSRVEQSGLAPPNAKPAPPEIAVNVHSYAHTGPMPYAWIAFAPLHKHDPSHDYLNYPAFFADADAVQVYKTLYREDTSPLSFSPGDEPNWEYQHPPLYYMLAGKALRAMNGHVTLVAAIALERIFSYLLAFSGLAIGLAGTARALARHGYAEPGSVTAMGLLYPLLAPEYFWHFASMGNDSLCLFFFGIAWTLALEMMDRGSQVSWIFLGLSLGLGCMTKATFVPAAGGLILFLLWHVFPAKGQEREPRSARAQATLKAAALAALMAVPVYAALPHGMGGGGELAQALRHHDAVSLLAHKLSWSSVVGGLEQIFLVFVWAFGTWSTTMLDTAFALPLYIAAALAALAYLGSLRRRRTPLASFPLWVILPLLMGLFAHVAVALIVGNTSTPGFYMHILAPAFALVYGLGLHAALGTRLLRLPVAALLAVSCLSIFFIMAAYATVFSGCAIPTLNPATILQTLFRLDAHEAAACWARPGNIFDRLSVLAYPYISAACALAALAALINAAFQAIRPQKPINL